MSIPVEIADFIRLTRGLSSITLARAIRSRWPEANARDIFEAFEVADGGGRESDTEVNGVRIAAPPI